MLGINKGELNTYCRLLPCFFTYNSNCNVNSKPQNHPYAHLTFFRVGSHIIGSSRAEVQSRSLQTVCCNKSVEVLDFIYIYKLKFLSK